MDEDVIQIEGQHYIKATSSRADERTRVIKHGDTFGVFDRYGDIHAIGLGEQGVFHEGTRHLSRLELRLGRVRPLLLSSTVSEANDLLTVDLTNPDVLGTDGAITYPRGELHIFRSKFLWQGVCYERLRLSNYGLHPIAASLSLRFDADFVDIFEVRGSSRPRRGERCEGVVEDQCCTLSYRGLDGHTRVTRIQLTPAPAVLTPSHARFDLTIAAQNSQTLFVTIACDGTAARTRGRAIAHEEAHAGLVRTMETLAHQQVSISCGNEQLDEWVERSSADLRMMVTETPHGPYPYAGVPWFSTVFGRDGIITALQLLWANPNLARGVLAYLAATQADAVDPQSDAEPGKILHETRTGEMAALGEVPFGRYYGSVDATPLFVVLAAAYFQRTADREFLETLWPHIERAVAWMDTFGDPDQDGFIEYSRRSERGLVQQGWKDSHDSVFHADGALAEPPIALCEVQAYAFAARRGAAEVALALGRSARAEEQRRKARALKERFEEAFWCDELSTYVLALDGHKRPCRVRSSNAGQCLFSGIASTAHARKVARTLLDPSSHSGWGIRTLAATEARYNPMSYHNGSVWPHDNALIALGFARYGLGAEALRVMDGMFAAASFLELQRLPELFCGFARRAGEGPTLYPVACLPQAWAAGTVFMLLQACLGMTIDARARQVRLENPMLPEWLPELVIRNLEVGGGQIDLLLERHPHDVGTTVLRRDGRIHVEVQK